MMTTRMTTGSVTTDTELVTQSLEGDRDAFGQIISRYQSLICALAYSATGNLGQSEDLAQETFITAWTRLGHLRERHKLRAWLCGIARCLIGKSLRREGREPIYEAEPLEVTQESAAAEPLPSERVISQEEEAILWRSLERIPAIYREPLVLFYREHQSIEAVARDLELSEDAVKQRLSRGRKLLQDEVLSFVEGALEHTSPGKAFTVGVIAALRLFTTSATAATAATAAATKGGSAAKAAGGVSALGALLSGGIMLLVSLFGVFGFAGRWIGRRMGLEVKQSARGRRRILQFWRTLAVGFFVLVLPAMLIPRSLMHAHPELFGVQTWSLSAFYWLLAAAVVIWVWQSRRDVRLPVTEAAAATQPTGKSYYTWIALGMLGPAWFLGTFLFALCFTDWALSSKRISETEARSIISERPDAQFSVNQYKDGSRLLNIGLPEDHRITKVTPLSDPLVLALAEKGVAYRTLIEDLDFHNGGVRGWLVLLSTFIVVAGTALLLRRPGTRSFHQQEVATPRAEHRERIILVVGASLAMIVLSLFLMLFVVSHHPGNVSSVEAVSLISMHKGAKYEIFQYDDGLKELWITPAGSRTYPAFIAPADDALLAKLAEHQIKPTTFVQGRDFGYRRPGTWLSLTVSFVLALGAVLLLRWVWSKGRVLPATATALA